MSSGTTRVGKHYVSLTAQSVCLLCVHGVDTVLVCLRLECLLECMGLIIYERIESCKRILS